MEVIDYEERTEENDPCPFRFEYNELNKIGI